MNRDILFSYFDGKATEEQERQIMEWAESSSENYNTYLQEQRLWCAVLLHAKPRKYNRTLSLGRFTARRIVGAVAVVLLLIICTLGLYAGADGIFSRKQIIRVPNGQRVELRLADGSRVWLNSKSRLEYSTLFGMFTRNVRLSGEGYFEVANNRRKPFVVQTEEYDVKVLGTTFNVYAFDGANSFETVLVDGSVEISSRTDMSDTMILSPNQVASAPHNGVLSCSELEDKDRLRWIEGIICLNNVTFGEMIERFRTYYDIDIRLNNPKLYDIRCTGKFRQSDGIDYSLSVLQNLVDFSFTHDSITNTIEIY